MIRAYVLVEGQTEETFIQRVSGPHLRDLEVYLTPIPARIVRLAPPYRKTVHGPLAVERIGLPLIRRSCPHFDEWVTWLEALTQG